MKYLAVTLTGAAVIIGCQLIGSLGTDTTTLFIITGGFITACLTGCACAIRSHI